MAEKFNPQAFGTGVAGLSPEEVQELHDKAEAEAEGDFASGEALAHDIHKIALKAGGAASRLTIAGDLPEAPNLGRLHESKLHESLHDEPKPTLAELDEKFKPPQSGLVA